MVLFNRAMSSQCSHRSGQRRGFNLVEAAVVLGVVGLVIGGIWVAAADVRNRQKASGVLSDIILLSKDVQRIFPLESYPTTNNSNTAVTITALKAGIMPATWYTPNASGSYNSLSIASPYGQGYPNGNIVSLGFWNNSYRLAIGIAGREGGYTTGMTQQDCNYLVTAAGNGQAKQSDFLYVQVNSATYGNQFYGHPTTGVPTMDIASVSCPPTFSQVIFWFAAK